MRIRAKVSARRLCQPGASTSEVTVGVAPSWAWRPDAQAATTEYRESEVGPRRQWSKLLLISWRCSLRWLLPTGGGSPWPQRQPGAGRRRCNPPVRRIVSLVPAATEMLFAMGAGDRLVGVSTYDRFPPEVTRIPQVGGLLDPNVERVLSLRADLVIVYSSQTELRRQLERAQVTMFDYTHRGLADVTDTLRTLGRTIGVAARANAAADDIERQLSAIRQRVAPTVEAENASGVRA